MNLKYNTSLSYAGDNSRKRNICFILFLSLLFFTNSYSQQKSSNFWSDISERGIEITSVRDILPQKYRSVALDIVGFKQQLATTWTKKNVSTLSNQLVTSIPFPDKTDHMFYVEESSIMAPELAAKYPEIKTYYIQEKGNPSCNGRIDVTQFGFHAIIFSPEGTIYIDPFERNNIKAYMSYYKSDFVKEESLANDNNCVIDKDNMQAEIQNIMNKGGVKLPVSQQRVYRLALAATGEYTAFQGGTVAGALSAMVTTINRVNGVYMKEVAIKMILVANTDKLIYTSSTTDPFTNSSGSKMLTENQKIIDSVIGKDNYDMGHVFSTGGGGIAYLGCICRTNKAGGVTGSSKPVGDPFDIDYVAHEMGHQFGGNHPFNGSAGNCSGANRNAGTAYEPGSGTTIMAYAGICSPQDLQSHSDDYFHVANLDEIIAYTFYNMGYNCAEKVDYINEAPKVTVGASGFYIPAKTPFVLTGSATDADKDSLSYCWEEYDLGPQGSPTAPSGNAPIFRSFNPTNSPVRIFPLLANIVNNKQVIGELLPTYARTLTFRLTARDNKGGFDYQAVQFTVDAAAGPFAVTYPNTNVTVSASSKQVIKWDVAGSDNVATVNCSRVNILLSVDGGFTYPYVLAKNTPNDGSEEIIITDKITTQARIKVEAADNIFFDISDVDFTITSSAVPVELTSFKADGSKNGVQLNWETATETNNRGFEIQRSSDKVNFEYVTFIQGKGTTAKKSSYSYSDNTISKGVFSYRLKQIDLDGAYHYSNVIDVDLKAIMSFALEQNHPNPFNPSTTIRYTIQSQNYVTLKVFDVLGKKVAELVNSVQPTGNYKVEFNTGTLPSGIYYYQLSSGSESITKKMMVIK